MTENTLNFVDGAAHTIDWIVSDDPGVRYNVQPKQVSLGAELQGADLAGGQLINPTVTQTLAFLVVDWDTDTMANLAANAQRLTVKTAGLYYWFGGGYFFSDGAGGGLVVSLTKNGASLSQSGNVTANGTPAGFNNFWNVSLIARLAVNDILTMRVTNLTPNTLALQAWRMAAQRLAP